MAESVYKIIEWSVRAASRGRRPHRGVARASESLRDLRVAEVSELDLQTRGRTGVRIPGQGEGLVQVRGWRVGRETASSTKRTARAPPPMKAATRRLGHDRSYGLRPSRCPRPRVVHRLHVDGTRCDPIDARERRRTDPPRLGTARRRVRRPRREPGSSPICGRDPMRRSPCTPDGIG